MICPVSNKEIPSFHKYFVFICWWSINLELFLINASCNFCWCQIYYTLFLSMGALTIQVICQYEVFDRYCLKIVQLRSFFWSVFSCIQIEYGDLRSTFPHSVRIQENTDQKNSIFGHFSRSEVFAILIIIPVNSSNSSYLLHLNISLMSTSMMAAS